MADMVRLYERIGDIERRIAALEAAAKSQPTEGDVVDNPHPAYAVAAEWREKCQASERMLRTCLDELKRERAFSADEVKRADANQAAADTLAKEPCVRIDGCKHTKQRMIEWINNSACPICLAAEAGMNREAADTLTILCRGDAVTFPPTDRFGGGEYMLCGRKGLAELERSRDTLTKLQRGETVGQDRLVHYSADTLEHVRSDRDGWRAKAEAYQHAADTLERLKGGRCVQIEGHEWRLTRTDYASREAAMDTLRAECDEFRRECDTALAERDALAAKVAELERRCETAEGLYPRCNSLQAHVADLERRLAERDRDAERWQRFMEIVGPEFVGHVWQGKVDAAIEHYKKLAASAAEKEAT